MTDRSDAAIDRHHGIVDRTSTRQSVIAVDREVNLVAVRRESVYQLFRCLRVIFDDKYAPPPTCRDLTSPNSSEALRPLMLSQVRKIKTKL
jgi:hypothetical protein